MKTVSSIGRRHGATALGGAVIGAMFGFAAISDADAATVTFSSSGVAESVLGLEVGSSVYNVVFTGKVSSSDWLNDPPKDFFSESSASAAATALAGALSMAGATSLKLAGEATTTYVQIPYSSSGSNLLSSSMLFSDPNWVTGLADGTEIDGNNFPYAADFTVVPLPAALPLFASALAGIGIAGWRRRKA
ncbi:hypothetical protein [uncultured Thiocystis sp.]|jgi:hypothetical protein|uniref:hypothetical protein n=1 Tax=uncultured Thiocystis sp. TaxID=1202134 RepID=UPI0025D5DA15|nr:hypothetical protein [uncultured Thiocystis sp.]